jgi:hypothetical protein
MFGQKYQTKASLGKALKDNIFKGKVRRDNTCKSKA